MAASESMTSSGIVGVIASVVTIALTVFNAVTKSTIDRQAGAVQAAQLELQKLDERLRERVADLEALKEWGGADQIGRISRPSREQSGSRRPER